MDKIIETSVYSLYTIRLDPQWTSFFFKKLVQNVSMCRQTLENS